ncbi:hypothetical protein AALP_AA3G060300 [Arabis alpina]|uniref:Uncharacterized protein n=1 Tax=Arabis alpina TaxID=50452 RepID=A0A087H7C3_ARAAL|nr:hypothetical protein AALP_AA3G060300 [Arabis alpina]
MKKEKSHETRISTPEQRDTSSLREDIMDSVCKSWKLYDNPYYCCSQSQDHHQQQRKAYIWDLNFIKVFMESELDKARVEIKEVKAELDYERKARKRAELMNKKLSKDVEEERISREEEEMQYKRILKERSSEKSEIVRMKLELEEERQMHKLAEVLREERVQMKLSEARLFLEEKLSVLEGEGDKERSRRMKPKRLERSLSSPASTRWENREIKRGNKGFVEFSRVMKAIKTKSEQWGLKLECQMVQLKTLLSLKTTPRCVSIMSSD